MKVDKGIPLPQPRANWPWKTMKLGDSFFAAGYVIDNKNATNGYKVIACSHGSRMLPGSKWSARTVTENGQRGVRVWRVL